MNIFDAHISGSLSVSSSAEISGDLTVLGTINATISGTTSNAISASHAAEYLLTTSFEEFTGSYTTGSFTGSFIGDGTNLYNIPASGVTGLNLNKITSGSVSASISPDNGFEVNTDSYFTGSVNISGSLLLNGDVVGVGKLDETTFNSYTSSTDDRIDEIETSTGSLNSFTSSINTTIKTKLDSEGVISGSIQVEITGTTGYSTFSSSIATTDLNQGNRITSLEGVSGSYATTGSNLFIGTQTHSGSIIPSVDNTYDLGSVTHQWRDVYISSGSLYIDGTKVISSTAQELIITTDEGQSIKILEGTTDSIVLQTADGNIELKSSADGDILLDPTNGKITLKGTVEVLNGQKIQSSVGGTPVVFANDIVVSGSIELTGTIDGIDLTSFSSSVSGKLTSIETTTSSLNSFTSSASGRLTSIETSTGSLNSFTSSINTTIKDRLNVNGVISGSSQVLNGSGIWSGSSQLPSGVVSGSSQVLSGTGIFSSSAQLPSGVVSGSSQISYSGITNIPSGLVSGSSQISITGTTGYTTFSSSIATTDLNQNNRLDSIQISTGSLNSFTSSINTTIKNKLNADGIISGSSQISLNLVNGYTAFSSSVESTNLLHTNRLTSLEGVTGSYATTGSNIFIGDQIVTGSLYVSQNLIVQGSSSLQNITASAVSIGTNKIILNNDTPAVRYAGISVFDSGSTDVTASLLYDSLTNNWKFEHIDTGTNDGSVLLFGPIGSGIDNAPLLTGDFLTKVENDGHGHHLTTSSVFDNGSKISLKNNTEITGSLIITSTIVSQGTTLVSGSSQISFNGITNKPTLVSGSSQVLNGSGVWSGSAQLPNGIISGSSQLPSGLVSGSSQVTYGSLTGIPSGIVSGSSQVLNGSGVWSGSAQLPSGIISGSSQLPSGLVSGSSQVSYGLLTGIPSGIISGSSQVLFGGITNVPSGLVSGSSQVLSGTGIFSGSAQLPSGLVSGSSQVSFTTISNKPTLVSGSSQISFTSISDKPTLVSGSSQIDLTATTNYSTGIKTRLNAEGVISGSSQVLSGTGIWSGSAQLPSGVVSGSSQVTYGSLTGIPSGLVSGSSQVSITGTTGFGTYLNQSVLTTSTPTFSTVSATTFTGGLSGNATTATNISNTGTVTLATATESNAITITQPTYTTDTPVKLLNFNWYSNTWSLGNIRSSATPSNGLGVYLSEVEKFRFTSTSFLINGYTTLHLNNYSTYALPLAGGTLTGDLRFNNSGYGRISYTDNYHGLILRGNPNNATGDITAGDVTSLIQHSGDFRFYRTNGTINEIYFQVNATAPYWRGNVIYHTGNVPTWNQNTTGNASTATTATTASSSNFLNLQGTSNLRTVTSAGVYREEQPDSGYSYTTTLNMNSSDGRQQLTIERGGGGMKFRGTTSGSGDVSWSAWKTVIDSSNIGSQSVSSASTAGNITAYTINQNVGTGNNVTFNYLKLNAATGGSTSVTGTVALKIAGLSDYDSLEIGINNNYDGMIRTYGNDLKLYAGHWRTVGTAATEDHSLYFYTSKNGSTNWINPKLRLDHDGHLTPGFNAVQNLGSSGARWNTVFTSDLSLSNGIGDYTIVEGENDLFLYNNKQNKVYKFMLQEVNPNDATPKRPE